MQNNVLKMCISEFVVRLARKKVSFVQKLGVSISIGILPGNMNMKVARQIWW
jgi:hypothetical protein